MKSKLKSSFGASLLFGLSTLLFLHSFVFALKADTNLEIRDYCGENNTCSAPEVSDQKVSSTMARGYGEDFAVDIYVKNPSLQAVVSAQTWLEYDQTRLEWVKIETDKSVFDFVAPGENQFDTEKGLVKIGRSAVANPTNLEELLVARVFFKVKTKYPGDAKIKFYDYQIGESGHTSVRIMDDNFPVNVLEKAPKEFIVKVNRGGNLPNGTGGSGNNQSDPYFSDANFQNTNLQPLNLNRPTGLKLTTGNGYIFLIWDKLNQSEIKGYNLYYSTTSGHYLQRRAVGNVNQYELNHLENGKTYYLAITAYDQFERETDYSDEVMIVVGNPDSASSPILISKEDYLAKVPVQPQNGPGFILLLGLLSLSVSTGFLVLKKNLIH